MRTFLFLVAALAAFLTSALAQLPHPSTSPTITSAMAAGGGGGGPFALSSSPACPGGYWWTSESPGLDLFNFTVPFGVTSVDYASAVEDLSQPTAAPYLAVAMVWIGRRDSIWYPPADPSVLPWANPNWLAPPVFWNPANYYAVPGFWAPCDLTWINPAMAPVAVTPTHQDVGPTLGFPRYFIGWSMPATHNLTWGGWWTCVQWVTIHPNGTLRMSPPLALPTF